MAAAVAISIAGMAIHTVREFGFEGLLAPASGFLPIVAVQLGVLVWWWRSAGSRRAATKWLFAIGAFQLVGGAVISVLPLPILPFVPAQTADHYVSHLIFGIAQIPLIWVAWRGLAARPAPRYP
jgi:hypothetical protein